MLFNSIDFAIFLPIVFVLYWFVCNKDLKLQNFLIVVASYFFYGWWDWKFFSLIAFSTVVDYSIGRALSTEHRISKRKMLLWVSILVNLGFLGFFKYYNFFLDNFDIGFFVFWPGNQCEFPEHYITGRHQFLYLPDPKLYYRCISKEIRAH